MNILFCEQCLYEGKPLAAVMISRNHNYRNIHKIKNMRKICKALIEFINNILDSEDVMNIAIIGMGHLGQAITNYFNGKRRKLRIVTAFDVDPEKVGSIIDDIPCYHMDQFEDIVAQMDVSIAVISSPTRVAPSLVLPIINAGIKGVLNFTSAPLNFPNGIIAENYDITTILEKVAYFVKESDEKQ